MFRWIRVISLLVLLFSLSTPAATQAARNQAAAAPRLVVLEGFFNPE